MRLYHRPFLEWLMPAALLNVPAEVERSSDHPSDPEWSRLAHKALPPAEGNEITQRRQRRVSGE